MGIDSESVSAIAGGIVGFVLAWAIVSSPRLRNVVVGGTAVVIAFIVFQKGMSALEQTVSTRVADLFTTSDTFALGVAIGIAACLTLAPRSGNRTTKSSP